jgi:ubiquinone/menaquinone biosynthesis C-methylase UbiE
MTTGQVDGDATARWLTSQRFAGLGETGRQAAKDQLAGIRDRVLAGARLGAEEHVVDLGAGTGLLTLAALDAVGPAGTVSAVDLSADSLKLIQPGGGGTTLRRLVGDVTALPLADGCADAAVARSVLVYVADLLAAIAEAARVLRPGGRLSVFEPVNARRTHDAELTGVTSTELTQIRDALADATPTARTLTAFDEQHAAALAAEAGFTGITITADVARNRLTDIASVEATLTRPGHPGAPTPLDTVALALGAEVARRYADAWRHAIRTQGTITYSTPAVYITATRAH